MKIYESTKKLSNKQNIAAYMYGAGESAVDIIRALNISDATLRRWRKIPEFQAASNTALSDTLGQKIPSAMKVLYDGLDDSNAWVRLQCAREIVQVHDRRAAADFKSEGLVVIFDGMESPSE